MSKHTEGPFPVRLRVKYEIIAAAKGRYCLGWAYHKENAELMAAAPELLEALEDVVDTAETSFEEAKGYRLSSNDMGRIKALLARVKGEANE